jgi:hypothetical protein
MSMSFSKKGGLQLKMTKNTWAISSSTNREVLGFEEWEISLPYQFWVRFVPCRGGELPQSC